MADSILRVKLQMDMKKALRQLQEFKTESKELSDIQELGVSSDSSEDTAELVERVGNAMDDARQKTENLKKSLGDLQNAYNDGAKNLAEEVRNNAKVRDDIIASMEKQGDMSGRTYDFSAMTNFAVKGKDEWKALNEQAGIAIEKLQEYQNAIDALENEKEGMYDSFYNRLKNDEDYHREIRTLMKERGGEYTDDNIALATFALNKSPEGEAINAKIDAIKAEGEAQRREAEQRVAEFWEQTKALLETDQEYRRKIVEEMRAKGASNEDSRTFNYSAITDYAVQTSVGMSEITNQIIDANKELQEQQTIQQDGLTLQNRLLDFGKTQVKVEKEKTKELQQQTAELENQNGEEERTVKEVNLSGNAFKGLLNTVKRYGMAMLGVRGVFTAVRRAMSSYLSANEETATKLQNIWSSIGAFLGPILDWIANKINMLASMLNVFVTALTGVDFVAKQNAKALNKQASATSNLAKAQRQSASFDEQNKLSDTSSSGGGSAGGTSGLIELPELDEGTVKRIQELGLALRPVWELIKLIGEFIINNWQVILAGILAFKIVDWIQKIGSLGEALEAFGAFFTGNWVALVVAGVVMLITYIITHWEEFKTFIKNLWDGVQEVFHTAVETVLALITGFGVAFGAFWTALCDNVKAIVGKIVGFVKQLWNDIKATIAIIVAGIILKWQEIKSWGVTALDWVKTKFNDIKDWLAGKVSSVVGVFKSIWDGIKETFGKVKDWFVEKFGGAWEAVKGVFSPDSDTFKGIKEGISTTFKRIVNKLIGGINSVIAWPLNKINGFLNIIKDLEILGLHPFYKWWGYNPITIPEIPLLQLAKGGIAVRPTSAVIGEAGKEAVLPLENNTDWMNDLADRIASSITIEAIPLNVDGKKIAQIVFKQKNQLAFVNNGR